MVLSCSCGNTFDFANKDGGDIDGFEFITDDNDNLIIHCNKCDKAIVLSDPKEVED